MANKILSLENISVVFDGFKALTDVNINVMENTIHFFIGPNGAGKSTFLKLLTGELETTTGDIVTGKNERISVLKQDHYQFDDMRVLDVVIMGNDKLYKVMKEKEELYSHTEFTEADGYRLADLEAEFLDMDGWNAENDAAILLNNLGIKDE